MTGPADCRIFSPDPEFQLDQDERRRRQPHARQPQALPQRMRGEASDREAEVGYGIQGRVGGSGQLHEHAVGKRRGVRRRDLRRSTRRNFDQVQQRNVHPKRWRGRNVEVLIS